MKNKNVGFLILGIAVVIGLLVIIFDVAIRDSIIATCSHGPTCSMYDAVNTQTWIALIVVGVILVIGLVLIFTKEHENTIIKTRTVQAKRKPISLEGLNSQEKQVIQLLQNENGTIFQADLIEKLNIGKVGLTRLLDKLEAKQLIERKRRGMNNVIVLKN